MIASTWCVFAEHTIPVALKDLSQWVCWRAEPREGKTTKVPVNPFTGGAASSTNPDTWSDYTTACTAAAQGGLGIGFVFSLDDSIVGVDLDQCREPHTGMIEEWACKIIERLDSYTEISPSGTGVHIYVIGTLPPGGNRRGHIEMYDHGRFFTVTGQHIPGQPKLVEDRSVELAQLHAEVFPVVTAKPQVPRLAPLSDERILSLARSASNREKFMQLWDGNWEGLFDSQSEGDASLCSLLAFYTQNAGQIDRLFRLSGLYRDKWNEKRGEGTWGGDEITKALNRVTNTYTPSAQNGHVALSQERAVPDTQPGPEMPVSLDLPQLPTLPTEVLPHWVEAMVKAQALATETPTDLGLMLVLGVLATACQKQFLVSPQPGHFEPLCLWTVPAMPSGERKTPVLLGLTKPLHEWQREQAAKLAPENSQKTSDRETALARIKTLRTKAANAMVENFADLSHEIKELESTLPDIPRSPRLWCQDITPERVGSLMAENDEAIAIISDEGGIFDLMGGRYSNGLPNLDVFLQSYSGSPVCVDRQGREPLNLNKPCLTICLSPQPDVLRGLTGKSGFRGRGLLARFLYALPPSQLGYRTLNNVPVPATVAAQYSAGVTALLEMHQAVKDGKVLDRARLKFSDTAYAEWKAFSQTVEIYMRDGGGLEHLRDWAGKLPGQVSRIAGLIHCAEYAHGRPEDHLISLDTVAKAQAIAASLIPHALAAFGMMGADPALDGARKVLRWINREQKPDFSARGCFKALQGSFPKMSDLTPAFDVLVETFHIYEEGVCKSKVGRRSQRFTVNPNICEVWK